MTLCFSIVHIRVFTICYIVYLSIWFEICAATCADIRILSRKSWNARSPSTIEYTTIPVENVIIQHTVTENCYSENSCKEIVRSIQDHHKNTFGWSDIGYNFLVGGDGNIYEGRGWHKIGAHTKGFNSISLGFAFIGNFGNGLPPENQIQAAKNFFQCGVERGELDTNYKLFGARQLGGSESPGQKLYDELKKWPHFSTSLPQRQ